MSAILTAIVFAVLLGDGRTARELIDAAQQAMTTERFQDALDLYEQAGALMPDTAEIPYNMGVAAYRAGDLERASALFDNARTLAANPSMQARSAYNLGTTTAQQAMQSRTGDPAVAEAQMDDATEALRTALDRFRDAIAIKPDDQDARANGELAWRWLQQLEQMQDQMQQQGQEQDQEQEQDSEDQQQQDQEQQDQQRGDQQQDQQTDQDQETQQQREQEPQPSASEEQQQQESPDQASPHERPMSREEAERLLQSVRDKEAQRRDELARQQARGRRPVDKDW